MKPSRSALKRGRYERIICWGTPEVGVPSDDKVLNRNAGMAADKLAFFHAVADSVRLPPWFTSKTEAAEWMRGGLNRIVFQRTLLRSHSGKGIVIARSTDDLIDAPLYTGYIRKQAEYRVHVFHDKVFVQQKRKRNGTRDEDYSPLIRSYHHGWVYCSDNVSPLSDEAIAMAKACIQKLELDFGAVDLIVSKNGTPYVLEVNTAPALTAASTREFYIGCFQNL